MDSREAQRREYLAAMGIPVWESRAPAAARDVAVTAPVVTPAEETVTKRPAVTVPPTGDMAPPGPSAAEAVDGLEVDIARLDWSALQARVAGCTACELHQSRTQAVFGVGNRNADWLVIGEAPGAEEDRRGEPFVGRAGQLLDAMLGAVGLGRQQVYIANILKCRPPNNRDPQPQEAQCCEPYLLRQVELIQPRLILAVGRVAAQNLLRTDVKVGKLRGQVHYYGERRVPVVVSYHPAYLLRRPGEKRKAWEDLKLARRLFRELSAD